MEAYTGFATVYDLFMKDVPYDEWLTYLEKIWNKYSSKPHLILDLACGTGSMTTRLHDNGYDVIGIDLSVEMLMVAKEKNNEILFLQQDMREFELYGTVDSIVCLCDGLNYLPSLEDMAEVFSLVKNYLNPEGLFVFDLNTEYKYKEILADNTFAENGETASFIWENFYDEDSRSNEYTTTFFIENRNGLYEKIEETHEQFAYSESEVTEALKTAGLDVLAVFDDLTFHHTKKDSERIYFVAQKRKDG